MWGIRKNRTKNEWLMINRAVEERRRRVEDSVVSIYGVRQPKKKLERELARADYRKYGGMIVH